MNFSPWSDATVGQLRISSRVGTNIVHGVQVRQEDRAFGWSEIGGKREIILEPLGPIDIKAELRLGTTHPSIRGDIEIGFIQTLVRCEREAKYGATPLSPPVDTFRRRHSAYPVKDGEGKPWYNDGNRNAPNAVLRLPVAPLGKYASAGRTFFSPFVAVYDRPKFGFPQKIGLNSVQSVNFKDTFLTCLAVKHGGVFFALHCVEWNMLASMTAPANPWGGIAIIRSDPIPPPYTRPSNIVLSGDSANKSEKMEWLHWDDRGGVKTVLIR
ncbi:MAG TPA: hypothetical protein VEK34_09260 [Methylocella sp.]|nr:hypothetical protein [Methylocella sp.]